MVQEASLHFIEAGYGALPELLEEISTLRSAIKQSREREQGLTRVVRDYMDAAGEDELVAEPYKATLSRPQRPPVFDVPNMPDGLILDLARRGILQVSKKALDAQSESPAAIQVNHDYRMPGGENLALHIEKV